MNIPEMIEEGKKQLEKLQFRKAEEQFKGVLEEDPGAVDAMIWLSRLYLMEKDQYQAERLLKEVLIRLPDHAEALALQGVLFMMQARYEAAIQDLTLAEKLDPNLQMIYYNLAKSYRKSGKLGEAEVAARKALAFNPGHFQAHAELSCILLRTERAREGVNHLQEAIRINPSFLKAYLILGRLMKTSGTIENVILWFRYALQFNPTAHVLREELCDLYAQTSDFQSAYRHAAAIAAQRNLASDYIRAGNYATLLGSLDTAEKDFQMARQLNPKVDPHN